MKTTTAIVAFVHINFLLLLIRALSGSLHCIPGHGHCTPRNQMQETAISLAVHVVRISSLLCYFGVYRSTTPHAHTASKSQARYSEPAEGSAGGPTTYIIAKANSDHCEPCETLQGRSSARST
eukprot:925032-Rhodomonas_salina.1